MTADRFSFWTWQSGISMLKGRGFLKVVIAKNAVKGKGSHWSIYWMMKTFLMV